MLAAAENMEISDEYDTMVRDLEAADESYESCWGLDTEARARGAERQRECAEADSQG